MTDDELKKEVDKLIFDYKGLEVYKRFKIAKQELEENQNLKNNLILQNQMKSSLKFLPPQEKKEVIDNCKKLLKEYDENPLVINYRSLKKELLEIVSPLIKFE